MPTNRPWGAIALLALALASCKTAQEAPDRASMTDEVTAEATVLAVDRVSREVTLQRADGAILEVVAGPDVRNFDRIAAGDTVTARYAVSLSARRLAPDEPDTLPVVEVAAARADPGQRPGAAIGSGVALTVFVKSVDADRHVVVFTDPDGVIHAIEAERDQGKRFVEGLKPGDRVELLYGEALALSVE